MNQLVKKLFLKRLSGHEGLEKESFDISVAMTTWRGFGGD